MHGHRTSGSYDWTLHAYLFRVSRPHRTDLVRWIRGSIGLSLAPREDGARWLNEPLFQWSEDQNACLRRRLCGLKGLHCLTALWWRRKAHRNPFRWGVEARVPGEKQNNTIGVGFARSWVERPLRSVFGPNGTSTIPPPRWHLQTMFNALLSMDHGQLDANSSYMWNC